MSSKIDLINLIKPNVHGDDQVAAVEMSTKDTPLKVAHEDEMTLVE